MPSRLSPQWLCGNSCTWAHKELNYGNSNWLDTDNKTWYFDEITRSKLKYASNASISLFNYHITTSCRIRLFNKLIERMKPFSKLSNKEHIGNKLSIWWKLKSRKSAILHFHEDCRTGTDLTMFSKLNICSCCCSNKISAESSFGSRFRVALS